MTFEYGLDKNFLPTVKRLRRGELTKCGQRALSRLEVVVVKDPFSTCKDCPLADKCHAREMMTIRLEYGGKIYGLLSISLPASFTEEKEEQSLFKEAANDISFALHSIELEEERKQKEKEIQKLNQFRKIVIDNANVWLNVLGKKLNIIIWNKAAEKISGYSRDEVVGHNKIWEWLYPDGGENGEF